MSHMIFHKAQVDVHFAGQDHLADLVPHCAFKESQELLLVIILELVDFPNLELVKRRESHVFSQVHERNIDGSRGDQQQVGVVSQFQIREVLLHEDRLDVCFVDSPLDHLMEASEAMVVIYPLLFRF